MSERQSDVIDKSNVNGHWSKYLDSETIDRQFNNGDLLILQDPQERLGTDTYSVSQIVPGKHERIKQLGLFWEKKEAKKFAHNRKFPLPEEHSVNSESER